MIRTSTRTCSRVVVIAPPVCLTIENLFVALWVSTRNTEQSEHKHRGSQVVGGVVGITVSAVIATAIPSTIVFAV